MARQRSQTGMQPTGQVDRRDLRSHTSEHIEDLSGAGSGPHHGLHRPADGFGESHVGTVQAISRKAAAGGDRAPHPVPQLKLALDGEVCKVVAEKGAGVELDGLGGAVSASHADQMPPIGQFEESNLHVADDTGAVQPLGPTFTRQFAAGAQDPVAWADAALRTRDEW